MLGSALHPVLYHMSYSCSAQLCIWYFVICRAHARLSSASGTLSYVVLMLGSAQHPGVVVTPILITYLQLLILILTFLDIHRAARSTRRHPSCFAESKCWFCFPNMRSNWGSTRISKVATITINKVNKKQLLNIGLKDLIMHSSIRCTINHFAKYFVKAIHAERARLDPCYVT